MILKFWQNDTCLFVPLDNLAVMTVRFTGNDYAIKLFDKQDGNWEVVRYSSPELCEKAINYVYSKYIENPNQIIEIPKEDDLNGENNEGDSIEQEVSEDSE